MEGIAEKMVTIYCGCCPMCKKDNYVTVKESDYLHHCENPKSRIQDIYPYLNEDDRELMISGICKDCWSIVFPEDEEDQ